MVRLAVLTVLLFGCGDDDGGGGDGGGSGPCVAGAPGVEVSVSVTCTTVAPCEFTVPVVRINYPPNNLVEYDTDDGVHMDAFDDQNRATFRFAYPSNALPGAASAAFFAEVSNPGFHIHGTANFDSYPTGCVRFDLPATDVAQ